jgi:hypothetical protein
VNDGAETGRASGEDRRARHWTAIRIAKCPLDRARGQLREERYWKENDRRQQEPEREAAIAVAP